MIIDYNLVYACLDKTNALFDFKINKNQITVVKLTDKYDALGYTEISGQQKYTVYLNTILEKSGLEDILYSTIYHELCHCYQIEYGFIHNWYKYISSDGSNLICKDDKSLKNTKDLIVYNGGHTSLWHRFTSIANIELCLDFDIIDTLNRSIFDIMKERGIKEKLIMKSNNFIVDEEHLTISNLRFEDRLPEGVTWDDVLSNRVDIRNYVSPTTIKEALRILKEYDN